MNQTLYDFIVTGKHRAFRRKLGISLAEEYRARNLTPVERMAERFSLMCREERAVILEGEQIVMLRTVADLPGIFCADEWPEYQGFPFDSVNNLAPNYYAAIKVGLLEKRKTADEYGARAIDNILLLTDKYLEEAKRQNRADLVEIFSHIPRYGARNFREALQFFRILHFALWLEGDHHNTVGRFDKYLYPYFSRDMEAGILDEASALELLEDFFLSFNKDNDLYRGVQQGDNGQSMMLGGIDESGEDVFNLLSALCLKASHNNRLIDPKINLRVSKSTPFERFAEATKLTRAGLGFPQYSNDDVVIPALEALGYEHEDAVNYSVAACWEFIIPFVGVDIPNIRAMSYPKAFDRAFHEHLESCETYEEFFARVKESITAECDQLRESIPKKWYVPSPFMNVLMDVDIYHGGKYQNFGFHGTGIATAADSLAAIKKYVFEEKTITKKELIDAVDTNFEANPELLHTLRYEAPKLGNNDDFVDSIATDLLDAFADALRGKKTCHGGVYRAGTGSAMYYLDHAEEIGATPDGRRKGEPFGTNYSISLFAKVKGPVSVIGSMTKQHFEHAINGGPLTLEFHPSVFSEEDGVEKIAALVKTFIDRGGHQLQLNTVNPETLLDAQKNPKKYPQLIVRIWGWSAYFVDLDKKFQDHVIRRQVYTV